jgi:hypothetical protein
MKNAVFWYVSPCGCSKNRRFGGTMRLHHQGDKNRWTKNVAVTLRRYAARCVRRLLVTATFLVHRFLSLWWWRRYVPRNVGSFKSPRRNILEDAILRWWTCSGPYGVNITKHEAIQTNWNISSRMLCKLFLRRMASSMILGCVALVRKVVSVERRESINRVTRIGELGITLTLTSKRRTQQTNIMLCFSHNICLQSASVASYY